MYYNGGKKEGDGIPGCAPCEGSCDEEPHICPTICRSGCGCPRGLVRYPTDFTRCIKKEACPPTGIVNLEISKILIRQFK